ncbi:Sodium channel protein type 5 subunit alpha [Manis javanica]|nr:Sodium channel protein type 5 subunit alpha [Manis javanica]
MPQTEIDHGEVEQRQQDQPAEQRQQQRHGDLRTAAQQEQKKHSSAWGLPMMRTVSRISSGLSAEKKPVVCTSTMMLAGSKKGSSSRASCAMPRLTPPPSDDDAVPPKWRTASRADGSSPGPGGERVVRRGESPPNPALPPWENPSGWRPAGSDLHQPDGQGCGQENSALNSRLPSDSSSAWPAAVTARKRGRTG